MYRRLINYLKAYFEKKPELKDPTEKAFSINGKGYYEFTDISKMKNQRALAIQDFYNELSMRCDREFLISHTDAVNAALDSKNIDIYKMKTLNMQLKERLEMIYERDIIYKIASAIFFTKNENPLDYDDLAGREKIALFKEQDANDPSMGFFFGTLFKSLIGQTDISEADLATYMTVGEAVKKEHLATISTILFNKNGMTV